jgi:phosphatidylinositol phospholipase C delta
MCGIGDIEVREALWEKQHWKGAGEERDQKLTFEEIAGLCRRLNIKSNQEDLFRLFMGSVECFPCYICSCPCWLASRHAAMDFDEFRRFINLPKGRPEIDQLYKKRKVDK